MLNKYAIFIIYLLCNIINITYVLCLSAHFLHFKSQYGL